MNWTHTPTSRLVLYALRDANTSLTITDLALVTGSTPGTLLPLTRAMAHAGLITRCPGKNASYTLLTAVL